MNKHTPGPWEVKKDDDSWRIRQKGSVKRRLGFTVERPVGEGFLSKEDALLAAAAPDLLEALQSAVADLFYQIESKHGAKVASEYPSIVEGKAAIAKATKSPD